MNTEMKAIKLPLSDEDRILDILESRHGNRPHPSEIDDHARIHFLACLLAEEKQGKQGNQGEGGLQA